MVHCNRCNTTAEPVAPPFRWKVLLILDWIAMLALTPLFGGLLGLNIVLVPLLVAMGGSIGTLTRLATTWTCVSCGAEVHTPSKSERPRRAPARRGQGVEPLPTGA
jgi:hypothetical protein